MRQPGEILLLSCYELGHQPNGLASPLATLEQAGYRPAAVDTSLQELSDEAICEAHLVAISVPMHTATRLGELVAQRVRSVNRGAHVAFYGLYAWLNAAYLLDRPQPGGEPLADSVIGGEFEEPLLRLARWLEAGASAAAQPEGVRFAGIDMAPHIQRIPYAVPSREALLPLDRYAGLWVDSRVIPAGYVEATRGCKHTCLHCPITPVYGGRFFAVPQDVVMADIRQQVAAGAGHITFGDPDFFNGPTHALKVVQALHAEFPAVSFDATIKVEHLLNHRRLLPELKAAGCAFVVSAVESLSDEVLRRLRKGHTAADVALAFDLMEAAGIPLRASLVSFTPWTSLDDYLALLRFVEARDLVDYVDPVHYAIRLLVPPGSALLSDPDCAAWLGELDPESYSYRWAHPDGRMDALYEEVSGIVAEGECEKLDTYETFARVKRAAEEVAGLPPSAAPQRRHSRPVPPRLTESWFCCAEPVASQLDRVGF